jgi:hypothetical protein
MRVEQRWDDHVERIASATIRNGGAAFRLDTCQFLPPMDIWSFPKYPARTVILPQNVDLTRALEGFIATNEVFLRESDCWLGTWVHPSTHDFYFDIATGSRDLEEARKIALEISQRDGRKIVAIYNSLQKKTVYL